MPERTFAQIMALLEEHGQLDGVRPAVIDDAVIVKLSERLAAMPIPPVSVEEIGRAWDRQRAEWQRSQPRFFQA
jgi:hypothetical protein